jgi:isopentenyl-diphosphate delta-isomerase
MHRSRDPYQASLAAAFIDWGIPTAQALINVKSGAPGLTVFASGGLRDGIDIAKCIALGADLGGMAGPFLKAADKSLQATLETIKLIKTQIQVAMFASGSGNIDQLRQVSLDEF